MNALNKNFLILFVVATAFLLFLTARAKAEVNVTFDSDSSNGSSAEECAEEFDDDTAYCLTPPQISEGKTSEFIPLLKWLLKFGFYAVGILAMLMIVIGGVQYAAAGAMGNPENTKDAKNRITMALGGLVLALSSWLILNTINPKLLDFESNLGVENFSPLGNTGGASGNQGGASENQGGASGNQGDATSPGGSQNTGSNAPSDTDPTGNTPTENPSNAGGGNSEETPQTQPPEQQENPRPKAEWISVPDNNTPCSTIGLGWEDATGQCESTIWRDPFATYKCCRPPQ